ncbi:hypothetical protein E8E12_009980 [Didymella heteroderae]|uniref:Uncharacterized protein n=1 Tax=Didymella heteroderae TaxID=1769908 RepID=A0A9P5C3D1_9PLEO|nr:hypothetical protein E8E12_009980 [Didymella heteroderae]
MPSSRAPSTPQSKTVGARLIESGVDPVFVNHASKCRSISSRSSKDDRVSKGVIKKISASSQEQALAYFPNSQRFAKYLANYINSAPAKKFKSTNSIILYTKLVRQKRHNPLLNFPHIVLLLCLKTNKESNLHNICKDKGRRLKDCSLRLTVAVKRSIKIDPTQLSKEESAAPTLARKKLRRTLTRELRNATSSTSAPSSSTKNASKAPVAKEDKKNADNNLTAVIGKDSKEDSNFEMSRKGSNKADEEDKEVAVAASGSKVVN